MKAHQLDMGGVVPGGFALTKSNVYENGLVLSPRPLYKRRRAGARDVEPDLRQRPLRRDPASRTCRGSAPSSTSASGCCAETVERYGLDAVHGAMRYVCDASAERMRDRARGDPGRRVGGRGDRSTATRSTTPRSTACACGHQAGRPCRGGLQRQLAAGADVHQRDGARRQDDRRASRSSTSSTLAAGSPRERCGRSTSCCRRAGDRRAAAGRRGVRLLGAEPDDDLGCPARARAGRRRRARSAGDRGCRRHPQRERRATRRHALDLGGPGRRRGGPIRRERPRRRRQQHALLPGQRARRPRWRRSSRARRSSMLRHEIVPDTAGAGHAPWRRAS